MTDPKPWTVEKFEELRPELCNFVRNRVLAPINLEQNEIHNILIHGHVKVGKREIVEYHAVYDKEVEGERVVHCLITAFHRKADNEQREELEKHNLKVFSLASNRVTGEAIEWLTEKCLNEKIIKIHYDECDYGTDDRQQLARIWQRFKDQRNVFNIFYSATPEELLFSSMMDRSDYDLLSGLYQEGIRLDYTPPPGYCGAERFLNENLVRNAEPFFERNEDGYSLTIQGWSLIVNAKIALARAKREKMEAQFNLFRARESGDSEACERWSRISQKKIRNIITLRLAYNISDRREDHKSEKKAIYAFLQNCLDFPILRDVMVVVDKDEELDVELPKGILQKKIAWSDVNDWNMLQMEKLILIVMDQTSSRSTEWAFHDRLYATHEFRPQITYNTVAQSQLRVAHYETKYETGFQPIRIFGHLKTFLLAAGRIDTEEYLASDWKKKKIRGVDSYQIVSINNRSLIHPNYPNPVPKKEAEKILSLLGCNTSLSQRVKGGYWEVNVIRSTRFVLMRSPYELANAISILKSEYPALARFYPRMTPQDIPFDEETGRYLRYLRGEYVFNTVDQAIKNDWGINERNKFRIVPCYRDDDFGIIIKYWTEEKGRVENLKSFKTMYEL